MPKYTKNGSGKMQTWNNHKHNKIKKDPDILWSFFVYKSNIHDSFQPQC